MMRLKKLFSALAILAFLGGAHNASAQWYLGPKAGLNLASISTNEAVTSSSVMGIHGGLTLRKQLSKQINIQMDVLYSQMGGELTSSVSNGGVITEVESQYFFDYVQVPLYANIEFPLQPKKLVPYYVKESWSSFHLYAGGYFGYGLGSQVESTTTIYTTPNEVVLAPKADMAENTFNAIDFGIAAGAGFSFKLDEEDKQRLVIDARYLMGLGNTAGSDPSLTGVERSNSAIQVSLGYTFKLTNRRHIRYAR